VKKIVCSCLVPKWENLTEMLKKISKGSKCTASANYLFLKKLNSINAAYYMQTKNGNLAPLLILPVAYL